MDYLGFSALLVGGFTACAEFGSYAFVHPVTKRLPAEHHIDVEQGLLNTFGRVMPILMPVTLVLAILVATAPGGTAAQAGPSVWRWLAVAAYGFAVISTVIVNVPINLATGRWDRTRPAEEWQATRHRWEFFQGIRSWLLLIGFAFTCVGFAAG